MIQIGNIIKKHCHSKHISISTLASKLNISSQALYRILNSNTMQLTRLNEISKALNHNFFQYFIHETDKSAKQTQLTIEENRFLKNKNSLLEQENKYLKEINELLKSKSQQFED
ncbi:MAG: helix-turn-helix transcriptional regulator [Bacteroidales bacterium]|nr:helix-turn-helix transcriptional regulator [Bacteroidales bacterium]